MSLRLRHALPLVTLLGLVIVACGQAPSSEPADSMNPLEGVWSLTASDPGDGSSVIDPSQPGLYIFAEGYYSGVYAPGAAQRVPSEVPFQPTTEEMVAQYESIIVNTGTYEISGSTVTFRPMLAKSPGFVGGQSMAEFSVDGNTLTLTTRTVETSDGISAPDAAGSLTLRRVE